MSKKSKDLEYIERMRRAHKFTKEELETYYNEVRKSAHTFKDRSKFDKKKSRQLKQKGWPQD